MDENVILTHRHTGCLDWDEKTYVLELALEQLRGRVDGQQTTCQEEFNDLARWYLAKGNCVWFFVGDGSFGGAIGELPKGSVIGYLPGGTGCAVNYALGFPRPWAKHAADFLHVPHSISLPLFRRYLGKVAQEANASGRMQDLDLLVHESGTKGLMANIGAEARVLAARVPYKTAGKSVGESYGRALYEVLSSYNGINVSITIDGKKIERENVSSVLVTKIPHYGLGMIMAPEAKLDDGQLHVRVLHNGTVSAMLYATSALTIGNYLGEHYVGRKVVLETEVPELLQINGDLLGERKRNEFAILDKHVKIKH